jgi:hypothetical protein
MLSRSLSAMKTVGTSSVFVIKTAARVPLVHIDNSCDQQDGGPSRT